MSNTQFEVGSDFSINKTSSSMPIQKKQRQKDAFLIAKYSSIGYYLVTPFLIGVFFGLGIDSYFNTKPMFTLAGIGFGFASVAYNLYKLLKDVEK